MNRQKIMHSSGNTRSLKSGDTIIFTQNHRREAVKTAYKLNKGKPSAKQP